jgi:hypothetical protein
MEMKMNTCLFPEELEVEERELLGKKAEFYQKNESLPKEVGKPLKLLRSESGEITGYTYEMPDVPWISLKELFQKEQVEQYHIDGHLLFSIAKKVLYVLMELSETGIYPGLLPLDSIFVHGKRPDKAVFFKNVEQFQAGELPSAFPWYPSDSRLFSEEITLFDRESQKKADAKLIYKILTMSEKGNAKIPPNPKTQELSYLFWNILSREWKDFFLNLSEEKVDYREIMDLLTQSIEEENYYTCPEDRKRTEEVQAEQESKIDSSQNACAVLVVLREAGKSAHDVSRQLYLLQEKLEEDPYYDYEQAFVLGDRHAFSRNFATYPKGFRSQLAHKIHSYSFGEALMIGCELLEQAMEKKEQPSYFYILLDGEIRNDAMYDAALRKLVQMKIRWNTIAKVLPARPHRGEGYGKLCSVCEEMAL